MMLTRPAIALALLLTGCTTTPPAAYYTLTPTAARSNVTATLSVGVSLDDFPEALDRAEIMVRTGPNRLGVTELHRWAGPLKKQFLRTLTENLVRATGSQHIAFAPWDERFEPLKRVSVSLLQFDGAPGCPVVLSARWSVSDDSAGHHEMRSTEFYENAGPTYPDLVMTQNRLIERLAREIAAALVTQ